MTSSPPPINGPLGTVRFQSRFLLPRYWPTWAGLSLLAVSRYLPARLRAGIGTVLGELYFRISSKRRQIAQINIDLCFSQLPAGARRRLVRRHFHALSQCLLDLGWLWWASPKSMDRRIQVAGFEHYATQRAQGKNLILLTCHTTALDVGGVMLSRQDPYVALFKPVKNALIDWFVARSRTRFDARVFPRSGGLLPLVKAVKQGAVMYYLPDEDLGLDDAVFAPFFGVPAATLTTLGRLARLCDAVVLPCFARLLPRGRGYEVRLGPPLERFPSGDALTDATRMNREIEQGIEAMPEQYMWTFKRFKTRPHGDPAPYDRAHR